MSFSIISDKQDRIPNEPTNVNSNNDVPSPTHPSLPSLFREKMGDLENKEKPMTPRTFSLSSLQSSKTPLSSTSKSKSFPDNPLPFLITEDNPLKPQADEKSDLPPPLSPISNNQNAPYKKKAPISPPGTVRQRPTEKRFYFSSDARFPF